MNDFVSRSARVLASFWNFPAVRLGQRTAQWDDAWAVDGGLPPPLFNNATLVRPLEPAHEPDVVARLDAFYRAGPAEAYLVWDAWRTADLRPLGLQEYLQPLMVRFPAAVEPPLPDALQIVEVQDSDTLLAFEEALLIGMGEPAVRPGSVWGTRVLGDPAFRFWLGLVGDRPVATAGTFLAEDVNFVGFVATVPDMRRRGLGTALAWRATLLEPSQPAMLHASDMGEPVYKKMGYRVVDHAALWYRRLPTD